jgi:hypothetical protein
MLGKQGDKRNWLAGNGLRWQIGSLGDKQVGTELFVLLFPQVDSESIALMTDDKWSHPPPINPSNHSWTHGPSNGSVARQARAGMR